MLNVIITKEKLSEILKLTELQIDQYVIEGMPIESNGEFNLIDCFNWYRIKMESIHKTEIKEYEEQTSGKLQTEYEKQKAIQKDLDYKIKSGKLVNIEDVKSKLGGHVKVIANRLDAIPNKLAARLVDSSQKEIEAILKEEFKDIMKLSNDFGL